MLGLQLSRLSVKFIPVLAVPEDFAAYHLERSIRLGIADKDPFRSETCADFC